MTAESEKEPLATLQSLLDRHAALLPPIPGLVLRLQQELDSEWVNVQRLSNLVRSDPAVAGPVLRLANSVYYRGLREVVEIEEAIQRMGFETLRNVATSVSLKGCLSGSAEGIRLQDFWRHSLLTAVVAVKLARRGAFDRAQLEQIWMAALLHDVGALVLPLLWPERWSDVVACLRERLPPPPPPKPEILLQEPSVAPVAENSDDETVVYAPDALDLLDLEKRIVGIDHARVGAVFLSRHWKIPDTICLLVGAWPEPRSVDPPDWAEMVRHADLAARAAGVCWHPGERVVPDDDLPDDDDFAIAREYAETGIPLVEAMLSPV